SCIIPTSSTYTHTLSLHDALPIYHDDIPERRVAVGRELKRDAAAAAGFDARIGTLPMAREGGQVAHRPRQRDGSLGCGGACGEQDRKSTRLNSSHQIISYAVFCLK